MELIDDVIIHIFKHSQFMGKIRLRQINKWCYNNLYIIDLCYDLNLRQKLLLSDTIICQHPRIEYLFAYMNRSIRCQHTSVIINCKKYNQKLLDEDLKFLSFSYESERGYLPYRPLEETLDRITENAGCSQYIGAIALHKSRYDAIDAIMLVTLGWDNYSIYQVRT